MADDQTPKPSALEEELPGDDSGDPAVAPEHRAESPGQIEAELAEERERVLRLQAEMQNLRQRQARELNDERRYGTINLMRDLLPVLDNVDRAIEAAEKSNDAGSLLEGFQLVRQQLTTVLGQHHCQPIPDVGELFDPHLHEAILQQPSDEQPAGHVFLATQTGYQLHDRVVRPAQVIVSTGPGTPADSA